MQYIVASQMEEIKKKTMWQYYIILGLGIIFFLAAIFSFKNTIAFLKSGHKTTATVVDLRSYESEGEVFAPIFTYRTINDQLLTYELSEGTNPAAWKIGETETIIYDPYDPSRAYLYSYFRIFTWTLVLLSISLPLIVVGAGYFVAERFLH